MKKSIKNVTLISLVGLMLASFTGCNIGNKQEVETTKVDEDKPIVESKTNTPSVTETKEETVAEPTESNTIETKKETVVQPMVYTQPVVTNTTSKPVVKPENKPTFNDPMIDAAENLINAQEALKIAENLLDKATKAYEDALDDLNNKKAGMVSDEAIELAMANVEKAEADLAAAKDNKTACESKLDAVYEEYTKQIAEANIDFDKVKENLDKAYEDALTLANETFETAKAEAESVYEETVENAQNLLDIAKNVYETKVTEINTEHDNQLAAILDVKNNETNTANEEYDHTLEDATTAYNNALSVAKQTYDNTIQDAHDTYDAQVEMAKEAYDVAISLLDSDAFKEAESVYLNALEVQKEAVVAKEAAEAELASAKSELEMIQAEQAELNDKITEAYDNKVKADAELVAAQDALEEAQNLLNTAGVNKEEALKAVETAQNNVNEAEKTVQETEMRLNEAREGTKDTTYESRVQELQDRINEAQQAWVKAENQIRLGSYGFFQEQGSTEALAVLDYMMSDAITSGYEVVLGDLNDATSLENMKTAIEVIAYGNALRTTDNNFEGRSEWLINDTAMALAQANIEHSKNEKCHWSNGSEHTDDVYIGDYNKNWSTGEILGWGYGLPADYEWQGETWHSDGVYDGWYHQEKESYENNDGGQTGHYLHMMNDGNVTGLAVGIMDEGNTVFSDGYGGSRAWAQEFGSVGGIKEYKVANSDRVIKINMPGYEDSRTFTQAEYYERFMKYYNRVMNDREVANNEIITLMAALDELQSGGNNVIVDQDLINELETAYSNALDNLNNKKAILKDAKDEFDAMTITVDSLTNTVDENTNALNIAEMNAKDANETYESILDNTTDTDLKDALDNVKDKESALETAITVVETADKTVEDTKAIMDEEKAKLDLMVKDAADALDKAKNSTIVDDAKEEAGKILESETEMAKEILDNTSADAKKVLDETLETIDSKYQENVYKLNKITDEALTVAKDEFDEATKTYDSSVESAKIIKETSVTKAENEMNDAIAKATTDKENSLNEAKTEHDATVNEILDHQNDEVSEVMNLINDADQIVKDSEKVLEDANSILDQTLTDKNTTENAVKEAEVNVDKALTNMNTAKDNVVQAETTLNNAQNAYDEIINSKVDEMLDTEGGVTIQLD